VPAKHSCSWSLLIILLKTLLQEVSEALTLHKHSIRFEFFFKVNLSILQWSSPANLGVDFKLVVYTFVGHLASN